MPKRKPLHWIHDKIQGDGITITVEEITPSRFVTVFTRRFRTNEAERKVFVSSTLQGARDKALDLTKEYIVTD